MDRPPSTSNSALPAYLATAHPASTHLRVPAVCLTLSLLLRGGGFVFGLERVDLADVLLNGGQRTLDGVVPLHVRGDLRAAARLRVILVLLLLHREGERERGHGGARASRSAHRQANNTQISREHHRLRATGVARALCLLEAANVQCAASGAEKAERTANSSACPCDVSYFSRVSSELFESVNARHGGCCRGKLRGLRAL